MVGALILIGSAVASLYAGFSHWQFYIVLLLGVTFSIGYVLFKPNAFHYAHKSPALFALSLFAVHFVEAAVFYGVGFLVAKI